MKGIKVLMISDEMRVNILHAVFINKNFIINEENCNYEKYLLELVNKSIYFREKSNFAEYTPPKSENHGECDCNSPNYQMDFKLLESTTRLHASKELTGQIQKFCDGVIGKCPPRRPNTQMTVTRLFASLRDYDCESLHSCLAEKYEYGTIEFDIQTYVKLLTFKKNLFFFFPYKFSFNTRYNFKYALDSIKIALEKDFRESNLFREKYYAEYDTFLAYIYEDNLIISKFEKDGKLQMIDCVYLFKSQTYSKLYEYTW
ncbi:TPA: hypothetical protein KQF10_002478 [Clostridioides difficile]|nr:hypothetical protein [Clostridioides difficile]